MSIVQAGENRWILETRRWAYALGINDEGLPAHTYFGPRLPYPQDYPEPPCLPEWGSFTHSKGRTPLEFRPWGGPDYLEPTLKVTFAGGTRDAKLLFQGAREGLTLPGADDNAAGASRDPLTPPTAALPGEGLPTLTLIFRDARQPLEVHLIYRVHPDHDIIERRTAVINLDTQNSLSIENLTAGSLGLPREKNYRLTYLTGKWVGEYQLQQQILPEAKLVLESRRGTTSHHNNPWFALDAEGRADENAGRLYYGALGFSGNWKITFEQDNWRRVHLTAGYNDFDFLWTLPPGETLESPSFYLGYSSRGFGDMSRTLHRFQADRILPQPKNEELRKVLYNSWEATYFDVNEENQSRLAEEAAALGVELFVMDDGWFGKRNNDRAGLGDWFINNEKFPRGLKGLIDRVKELGMEFGLWVEPEMVNPDSRLFDEHPDWVYRFEDRENIPMRNQLVLNLAMPEVRQFIFQFMDRILSENDISFIKWDMNRNFSEIGWARAEGPETRGEAAREIWIRHALGVYEIVEALRINHPDVTFQSCSGGGGRIDPGILRFYDQAWISDNTDAFDRLKIQEGYSYAYAPRTMEAWVTTPENFVNRRVLPLEYRFLSSMMGVLGVGDNIIEWTAEEKETAQRLIAQYKEIRPLIQQGDLYRIESPREGSRTSLVYTAPDKKEAALFVFLHAQQFGDHLPPVRIPGLEPEGLYSAEGWFTRRSGLSLAEAGLSVSQEADFDAKLIRIKRI